MDDADVQRAPSRKWVWVVALCLLVGGGLVFKILWDAAHAAPQSPADMASLAFRALVSKDVDAFVALGPTKDDLEFLFDTIRREGDERERRWAQRKVDEAGDFAEMEARHRDNNRRSFEETHQILENMREGAQFRFLGLKKERMELRERHGMEGGDVYFWMLADDTYVVIRLAGCARLDRGWVCAKGVHFDDAWSDSE